MPNQGALPVVMEVAVAHGDPITGVGDVEQPVVVVFRAVSL